MQDASDSTTPGPSRLKALKAFSRDARRFFEEQLWDQDVTTLPGMKRRLFSACRIGSIVVKGFIADNCGLQASALTYITLMSMIPVLAMMFSFSKGLGMPSGRSEGRIHPGMVVSTLLERRRTPPSGPPTKRLPSVP